MGRWGKIACPSNLTFSIFHVHLRFVCFYCFSEAFDGMLKIGCNTGVDSVFYRYCSIAFDFFFILSTFRTNSAPRRKTGLGKSWLQRTHHDNQYLFYIQYREMRAGPFTTWKMLSLTAFTLSKIKYFSRSAFTCSTITSRPDSSSSSVGFLSSYRQTLFRVTEIPYMNSDKMIFNKKIFVLVGALYHT